MGRAAARDGAACPAPQNTGAMAVEGSATMTAVAINHCTAEVVRKRAARTGDKRARRGRAWGHAHMLRAGTAAGGGGGVQWRGGRGEGSALRGDSGGCGLKGWRCGLNGWGLGPFGLKGWGQARREGEGCREG